MSGDGRSGPGEAVIVRLPTTYWVYSMLWALGVMLVAGALVWWFWNEGGPSFVLDHVRSILSRFGELRSQLTGT